MRKKEKVKCIVCGISLDFGETVTRHLAYLSDGEATIEIHRWCDREFNLSISLSN